MRLRDGASSSCLMGVLLALVAALLPACGGGSGTKSTDSSTPVDIQVKRMPEVKRLFRPTFHGHHHAWSRSS